MAGKQVTVSRPGIRNNGDSTKIPVTIDESNETGELVMKRRIGITAMQGVSAHLVRVNPNDKKWDDTVIIDIGPGLSVHNSEHGDGKVDSIEEGIDKYFAVVTFKKEKNRKYRYPVPDAFTKGILKVKNTILY